LETREIRAAPDDRRAIMGGSLCFPDLLRFSMLCCCFCTCDTTGPGTHLFGRYSCFFRNLVFLGYRDTTFPPRMGKSNSSFFANAQPENRQKKKTTIPAAVRLGELGLCPSFSPSQQGRNLFSRHLLFRCYLGHKGARTLFLQN